MNYARKSFPQLKSIFSTFQLFNFSTSAKRRSFSTFQLFNLSTLLAALLAAPPAAAMDTGTIDGSTTTLNGGTIYTVSGNVEIPATTSPNALTVVRNNGVASGNKVVINIPEGCSLTLKGKDANGRSGAGAGIMLPNDMMLYITGKGKLTATGGNAAKGLL